MDLIPSYSSDHSLDSIVLGLLRGRPEFLTGRRSEDSLGSVPRGTLQGQLAVL